MKKNFEKFFFWVIYKLYTSKNPQKFTDFEGVVRFLIRQKNKKLFEKNWNFCLFYLWGVIFAQPIKSILEWFFDGFNDLYHKSVSQTLILSQKTISFMQNRWFATVKKLKNFLKKIWLFPLGGGSYLPNPKFQFFWISITYLFILRKINSFLLLNESLIFLWPIKSFKPIIRTL